jgi:hypothetical protein
MKLPTFIVLGPPRTGTTWLYKCLDEHPEVYVSDRKEVRYFDEQYKNGPDWYAKAFAGAPDGVRAIGDITPGYFQHPGVPERIHELLGDRVELFVIHRDPIERAYSAYKGALRRGETDADFAQALEEIPRLSSNSQYARQLERFLNVFPSERLHLMDFESIAQQPLTHLQAYYHILGLSDFTPKGLSERVNAQLPGGRSPRLTTLTRHIRQAIETTAPGRKIMWLLREKGLARKLHDLNAAEDEDEGISDELRAALHERWFADDEAALETYVHLRVHLPARME